MSEQIEIEFKNILTKKEYQSLQLKFKIDNTQIKEQVNHYFDTTAFFLKNAQSALRLREKNGVFELTLKQPASVGLLETNQTITYEEANGLLTHNRIPNGSVKAKLLAMGVPLDLLQYFGALTTKRIEIKYKDGLLVLDHSSYLNVEDFEIEYEVINYEAGKLVFIELLSEMNIPIRKTENKIQRFYRQKYL